MKRRIVTTLLLSILTIGAGLSLTACGEKEEADTGKKITVGANITPHSEILYEAKKILAKEGIELEVREIEDSVTPNTGVTEGSLDANYFQHQPYLDDYNEKEGTKLVSVGAIHYEPFAIYSSRITDLDELKDGAKVAVPNNVTNEARALLLLEQEGIITLKEEAGIQATVEDISENPKNITFVEVDPSQLVNTLADVEIAVINGNYAIEGGLHVSDSLAAEANDGLAAKTYANIVATSAENKDNPELLRLVEVLQSDEIKEFINNNYNGAVVPLD